MPSALSGAMSWLTRGTILLGMLLLLAAPLTAQDKKKADEKPKIPAPEDLSAETEDGIELKYTFYGSVEGKKAVPIILVHGWESRRTELDPLAKYLQSLGHAVLVPDLRGHGDSNVRKLPGNDAITLKPVDLKPFDFANMISKDYLLLKRELLTRNNAGELNIELLTIVGIDVGAVLALNWAALDWSQPILPTKLGRDVKALILISPVQNYKTLNYRLAMNNAAVVRQLSVMLIGGASDAKTNTELKRLDNAIGKFHPDPKPDTGETDEEFSKRRLKLKNYYIFYEDTVLQGVKLINAPQPLNVAKKISAFIQLRLVDQAEAKDLPAWEGERKTKEPVP